VEEPFLVRDGLIPRDAVGADPVTYEAYSSPQRGDAWVVVGDKQLCAIYYGPTDATLWGCFAPGRELANGLVEPIENRRNSVIALVPDVTRDARALSVDGTERELESISNVLVAFDVQPDTVSWTTPKGQAVGFGGQTWPADVGVDLAPRFSVVDPANAVPPESVEPPLPAEFDPVEVYDAGPIARGVEAQVVVAEDIVCVAARFVGDPLGDRPVRVRRPEPPAQLCRRVRLLPVHPRDLARARRLDTPRLPGAQGRAGPPRRATVGGRRRRAQLGLREPPLVGKTN
jgi:hypothetical protein